jgi:tetratricopeptide (TPR) repeat protein
LVIVSFSLQISAQTDNQRLLAFQKSYQLEQEKNYIGSIEAVKAIATTPSYETNLRLGWLNYMAGLYKESMEYYQAAIDLAPNSIEAKIGYINPASALGNTDQVITQYTKIIEIAPAIRRLFTSWE